jgi:carboxyl-terminal processing protease
MSLSSLRFSKCILIVALLTLSSAGTITRAEESAVDVSGFEDAGSALAAGEKLETGREWAKAVEHYEACLKRWEKDEPITYALRRTRIHFGIDRRYADRSFEDRLLTQGRSEALDLLEDILSHVQFEYVDPVSVTRLIAHGTESLYMALGNEKFLEYHHLKADSTRVERVRQTLTRDFWNRKLQNRQDARAMVTNICEMTRGDLREVPDTAIVMEYIFGVCNALDEYSNFMTPDRYSDLFGSIQGELVGIGIEMKEEKGKGMHLLNVLLDSPAEAGGLLPDDYITEIDGVDCRDMSTDDAARLLKGQAGSRLSLTWTTPEGNSRTGDFIRRRVVIKSITKQVMLDEEAKIGYIQMKGFQNTTAAELDDALRTLEKQGMKALIWDLRGNPGGLLETAAAVLERFIDGDSLQGVLVTTKGRSPEQNQVFRANSTYANTRSYPLVLIVDELSASASEIVAGAIHDHRRGEIVGRKTYGKWSVQSIIQLPGDTGLKLTTAKFFSPADKNYAGEGIAPDIDVPAPEDLRQVSKFPGRRDDIAELIQEPEIARSLEVLERRLSLQ